MKDRRMAPLADLIERLQEKQKIKAQIASLREIANDQSYCGEPGRKNTCAAAWRMDDAADSLQALLDVAVADREAALQEIERLQKKCDYKDEVIDQRNAECSRQFKEIERLRHEIDVQCSSEYVERILKENERLQKGWESLEWESKQEIERLQKELVETRKWRQQNAEFCDRARDERDYYRDKYEALREGSDD